MSKPISNFTGFENVDWEKMRENMIAASKTTTCHYCRYSSENRDEFRRKSIIEATEVDDKLFPETSVVLLCKKCYNEDI